MNISREELEERYAQLNDRALLARYSSGTLTELAADVARAELVRRGIPLPRVLVPESSVARVHETIAALKRGEYALDDDVTAG